MWTRLVIGVAVVGASAGVALRAAPTPADEVATPDVECSVAGPNDGGPIHTDSFGTRKTVIAVGPDEVPNPIPEYVDAYLKDQGAVLADREEDGRVTVKAGWIRDRRATGRVKVTGKRLDAAGGGFRARVNRRYGGRRFARIVPSTLRLGSTGCWRFRTKAGQARVRYVVLVRYAREGEF